MDSPVFWLVCVICILAYFYLIAEYWENAPPPDDIASLKERYDERRRKDR